MRPRLLDLFCGAGGAAMGYHLAGLEVVGVDVAPQPRYPFEFHQADAISVLRAMVDYPSFSGEMWRPGYFQAVHASPPCRDHSALAFVRGAAGTAHLLPDTRALLGTLGLPYVVENVATAEQPGSLVLCGSEFGLCATDPSGVLRWLKRHRQFESNWLIMGAGGCNCYGRRIGGVYGHGGGEPRTQIGKGGRRRGGYQFAAEQARAVLGVPWMNRDEAAQAIPPAYTRFIGEQLLSHLSAGVTL